MADVIKKYEIELNKKLSYFIQVNIKNEMQKSGIPLKDAKDFFKYCLHEKKLNILGLMVIPPNDENTSKYFKEVSDLNSDLGLKELSMGMSSDYLTAIKYLSTYIRVGSSIFGQRS